MNLEVLTCEPPKRSKKRTPVLFVHGAWHGAWYWMEHFLPYFARCGYPSYAINLRGHGKSDGREKLRWSTTGDFVEDIRRIASQFQKPPVLIGHSMGGFFLRCYLEKYPAAAAVVMAPIPVHGIWLYLMRILFHTPCLLLKTFRHLDPYQLISTPQLAKDTFFSPGIAMEQLQYYFSMLQSESFVMLLQLLFLNFRYLNRVKVPLLVFGAENDKIFKPYEIKATAKIYGTKAEIFKNMSHDMMLDPAWQVVADRIIDWLKENRL